MQKKKQPKTKSNKLDILQDVLPALDRRDRDYYKNLPEEGKKSLALQEVILRWMSAVGHSTPNFEEAKRQGRYKGDGKGLWPATVGDTEWTEYHLIITNEGPNMSFGNHALYGHAELEWMLLALAGSGKLQEHTWIPSSPKSDTPTIDAMLRHRYPLASKAEIRMLKNMLSAEEAVNMVEEYGNPDKLSDGEASKIKKIHGTGVVFDKNTVKAEMKKLGKRLLDSSLE